MDSFGLLSSIIEAVPSPAAQPSGLRGPLDSGAPQAQMLTSISEGIRSAFDGALTRVWLVRPGDICRTCAMLPECPDQRSCLHLVASAGVTSRTDGPFRRFPIGARQVGQVAVTRRPFFARGQLAEIGLADSAWLEAHRIRTFAAFPLEAGGELVGVLGIFSRRSLSADDEQLLAACARHAGIACALARAWSDMQARDRRLSAANGYLRSAPDRRGSQATLPGVSAAWRRMLGQVDRIAASDVPVLLQGDPGSGREMVARMIHAASRRSDGDFVHVPCAATSHARLESLLFGGSVPDGRGSSEQAPTLIDVADGGTLFLEDVGEAPIDLQPRLLRVVRDGVVDAPDGAGRAVSLRLIVSARDDLPAAEATAGGFLEDLRAELAAAAIHVPSLHERREDVALLARHFASAIASETGRRYRGIDPAYLDRLVTMAWPGNLRELRNVIERAVLVSKDGVLRDEIRVGPAAPVMMPDATGDPGEPPPAPGPPLTTLAEVQREAIERALAHTGGRVSGPHGAAALLGLKPTTLESRMKRLGVRRPARRARPDRTHSV